MNILELTILKDLELLIRVMSALAQIILTKDYMFMMILRMRKLILKLQVQVVTGVFIMMEVVMI